MKKALYGLPEEVRFCTRCVISNQRPGSVVEFKNTGKEPKPTIKFDDEGVCSACRFAEIKENKIDWDLRKKELLELCDWHRSKDGSYDCVVPGSGGKDSVFTAHVLREQYGMNPLTVTWAPHIYTEVGWRNMQNWMRCGFDNMLFTPDAKVHRLLTRLAFENLCHPFQPFIIGQRLIGPRIAALYGIPLIFYGENQAEYGNDIEANDKPTMDPQFFMEEPDLDSLVLGGVLARELVDRYGISINDLNPYLPVQPDRLKKINAEMHYLSYYIKWDPQENYYYASEHCDFEANTMRTEGSYSKYSSIDDRIDPLHYFTTLAKFGIGRATYDAAQEIRNGKITREEGVSLVHRYDTEFPSKDFREITEYMGITEDRFWEVIDAARSPHLWEKVDGDWKLRHQVQNLSI
ncbi:LPS biosynthesis protein PseA [Pseudodesulfovibrio nedwellii]|uniref:LPS biosynthesis protein PseA n=1 Tax=Pseudodesulfovibrio nedwellii TaxID=2973072 RepID=A0ABN6S828_9BACT|nr:N-acetyl sugar amidotransferase [Pseudodesulfovibrio nedwellii]BDQ38080.1 LPS biosynthesis protein PseA [Pseudodesulfovibrio nedwellii]